jgi:Flp pilus assembly protein TadG
MKNINIMSKNHIRNKGSSILELAFVLPILLMLTLGIIGFGFLFLRVQQITNAARHGARVAARYGDNSALAQSEASTLLTNVGLMDITTNVNDSDSISEAITMTVTGEGLDVLNLHTLNMLKVPMPYDFTASVTMAKEGP